ncbi:GlxA family transcriptional regulator [Dongia soli]|uniref:Helix-turn-helix domain-containing protein n=1 Tax=Dongia soli TaxID=600628 RepID=A0ABU5EFK7_9PROT|nr:helix-turn-helix domain-containing protein [Dongia soli]MDY0885190.1 helix-turn-helix domain-containing protein [Dongia soli]
MRRSLATGRIEITILMLPGFPLYELAALCDTFGIANARARRTVFTWQLLSSDGLPVLCSLGTAVQPARAICGEECPDNIVLLSGDEAIADQKLLAWLRRAAARHSHILASGDAVPLLAEAGLLDGRGCTAPWPLQDSLSETWPDLDLQDRLYVADNRRLTCAGKKALIDFALACTAEALDERSTRAIADALNHDRLRPGTESQHICPAGARGIRNPTVLQALEIIDAHLAEPISTEELAEQVGICPRQLQRLFKRCFGAAPSQFAMQRRMQRARHLLHQTQMSITEVGTALGFVSLSHFSRCYMRAFGRQPRQDRLRLICD